MIRFLLCFAVLTMLSGCTTTPRVSFYTLNAPPFPDACGDDAACPVILLGPLTLPEMVDRPQLVVRTGDNRVGVVDASRWAQPLKSELARALAANLAHDLATQRVYRAGQSISVEPDFRVNVDVLRFESRLGKEAVIEVLWAIRHKGKMFTGHSIAHEKVLGESHDLLVAAHGQALKHISHEIAEVIRRNQALGE